MQRSRLFFNGCPSLTTKPPKSNDLSDTYQTRESSAFGKSMPKKIVVQFQNDVKAQLNWSRLASISARKWKGSEQKYLQAEKWLVGAFKQAIQLGLTDSTPISILDLGTGPGYFPYVCRGLGHQVTALDRPGCELYDELCAWLGTEVVPWTIEAKVALPNLGRRFDLVTALRIGFNQKTSSELFDLDDWDYFLRNITEDVLAPGGRIALKMIEQSSYDGPGYGDPDLMALFKTYGAFEFDDAKRFIFFRSPAYASA